MESTLLRYFDRRQISDGELRDELEVLKRFGGKAPILGYSNNTPRYIGRDENGNPQYCSDQGFVTVRPGEVIDSHGNVVNLSELRARTFLKITSPESFK